MKERRKYIRFNAPLEAEYIIPSKVRMEGKTLTRDFSREGLRLVIGSELTKGMKISLKINLPDAKRPIHAIGELAWSKVLSSGKKVKLEVGAKLLEIDSSDKSEILDYVYNLWYKEQVKKG